MNETATGRIITVDYGQTLEQMIAAGKYDWVDPHITADKFPVEGTGIKKVRNRLFHFGRDVSSNNAVAAIKKEGFEPATHVHCLAFGATFPEGQRKYPIIGLGSGASFHGRRFVPCLSSRNDDERSLDLTWCGGAWTWNGDCRFLGVQEVSDA